jgi:dephospho-CoA kinase
MNPVETIQFPGSVSLGVTGGAGSGKSHVCRLFEEKGARLVDADRIAREVVMPGTDGLAKVADRFGSSILDGDGALDRSALRRRILADDDARKALEAILHPEIISLMQARIGAALKAGAKMVVSEVPLLFELGMASHFDKTLLVTARREVKVRRLMDRDRVSAEAAGRLLDLQMSDVEKVKHADIILENNGNLTELRKNVDRLYEMIYL